MQEKKTIMGVKIFMKKKKKLKVPESKIWEDKSNEKEGKRKKKTMWKKNLTNCHIWKGGDKY